MKGFAEEKIQGGKLIKIKIEYDSRIRFVQILGDFFVHPEEGIGSIEKALTGLPTNIQKDELIEIINEVIKEGKIQLIGITPEAITSILIKAMTK